MSMSGAILTGTKINFINNKSRGMLTMLDHEKADISNQAKSLIATEIIEERSAMSRFQSSDGPTITGVNALATQTQLQKN